jgi:polar amino acid transport system substrate-binding protein
MDTWTRRRCLVRMAALWPAAACTGLMPQAQAQAQATLRLARIENIPDQFVGGELLKAVYGQLGMQVQLVDLPAKRALIESSQGRIDGEVQRIPAVADEYPTLLPVRVGFNYIEPSAFTRWLKFRVEGWASLRPYAVGIVRGVGSSERGTQGLPRVEAVGNMEQLLQMLASDRIDVAVADRFSGELLSRQMRLAPAVQPLEPPLQRIDLYHFLHGRHRDKVPVVEDAMRRMAASGELERLRREITTRMLEAAGK